MGRWRLLSESSAPAKGELAVAAANLASRPLCELLPKGETRPKRGKHLPFDFVALGPDDLKNLTCKDGLFDIAKSGSEDPILTAIHRVDFR